MTTTSNIHPFTEWAKSRLDEMDAALAVFETKAKGAEKDTGKKADAAIANMKKRRDAFRAEVEKEHEANAKAWSATNAQLEDEWHAFEEDVDAYWESVGDKAGSYGAAFRAQADAQKQAWRDTAARIKAAAKTFQADRRTEVDAAIVKSEHIAQNAGAKLDNVSEASKISWVALKSALTESRSAFDAANTKAQAAFKDAIKDDDKTT